MRFDFNDGCRVKLPAADLPWKVRLSDLDTGNILYETTIGAGMVASAKHYYLRIRIEIWLGEELAFAHDYDAVGRKVLIRFPVSTLGDTIGWFSYVERFQRRHRCELTCAMAAHLIPLFEDAYPDIRFTTVEEADKGVWYATYTPILYFNDVERRHQPSDYQLVGLHRTAAYILGVDPAEVRPRIALGETSRPIAEPYVCIATQSTTQCKYWNNPRGWREVITFLKGAGYRVICIDQKAVHGTGVVWNHIPHGAEDETGEKPLLERARWLKHADFFIGLSSGLSWLAWAVECPVVLISGFTHPVNEFATPYRVINYHTCNSCWNDPKVRFDHKDFLWCPRHAGTSRQFECTRLITSEQVKRVITGISGFGAPAVGPVRKDPRKNAA